MRRLAYLLAAGIFALATMGQDSCSTDDDDPKVTKDASEIEDELEKAVNRRISDVAVGEVTINCPDVLSENLDRDRPTECTAKDESGALTEFTVRSQGGEYEVSVGEIALGLAGG